MTLGNVILYLSLYGSSKDEGKPLIEYKNPLLVYYLYIRTTFQEAENDISRLREDLQQLLHSPSQHRRQRRYAHLAAAGASLLTIGAQLATGCVAGVLGSCPNEQNIAANRQQIQTAIANIEASNQHWAQVQSETNE